MTNKSFGYSDVLGFGWDVMKSNFWFFTGILFVLFTISIFEQIAQQMAAHFPEAVAPFLVITITLITYAIDIILGIGLIKIALSFCDDIKPTFGVLFDGLDCFWRYLAAGLLYGLIIIGVFVACALPFGVFSFLTGTPPSVCLILPVFAGASIFVAVLSIKFSLCFYFVIDKGFGPIKALKASSRATNGAKGALFVFGIICGFINLLGALCFMVGLLATIPTVIVATALVYKQLSSQTPELAEFGISTPAAKNAQLSSAGQAGLSIRLSEDEQSGAGDASANPSIGSQPAEDIATSLSVRLSEEQPSVSHAQPASSAQPAGETPLEGKGKNKNLLWVAVIMLLVGVLITTAIGLGYYLRNDVNVPFIPPKVALNGILYSEDNPSAVIGTRIVKEGDTVSGIGDTANDITVIKINKDGVEFDKNGRTWTQKLK